MLRPLHRTFLPHLQHGWLRLARSQAARTGREPVRSSLEPPNSNASIAGLTRFRSKV
jgi:hypothetical protein